MDNQPAGAHLMQAAIALVLDFLRKHPEGVTNREIGVATGLNLEITRQEGYVTWTILRYLLENGRVVRERRLWKLPEQP